MARKRELSLGKNDAMIGVKRSNPLDKTVLRCFVKIRDKLQGRSKGRTVRPSRTLLRSLLAYEPMSGRCGFLISGGSTRIFDNAIQTAVVRAVNTAGCFAGYPGPQSCVSFDPSTTSYARSSVLAFEGDLGRAAIDVARADAKRPAPRRRFSIANR